MLTHILFVNRQLAFAVSIKQALERTGSFEVHPFTSLESAMAYLSSRPQDVAVVDFTLPDVNPATVVQALRDIQPGLAIIAMPRQPEAVIAALGLQGSVNSTVTARELIPVINRAIEGRRTGRLEGTALGERGGLLTRVLEDAPASSPPQTRRAKSRPPDDLPEYTSLENVLSSRGASEDDTPSRPVAESPVEHAEAEESFEAILSRLDPELYEQEGAASAFDDLVNSMRSSDPHRPLPARHQQFVEFILTGGMDSLLDEINRSKTDELPSLEGGSFSADDKPEAESLSSAPPLAPLIDEEPPPPSFEDSGTVGDLYTGVNDASFRSVLSILRGEEAVEEPAEPAAASDAELREAFASFYESQAEQASQAIHFPTEDEIEAVLALVEAESIQPAPPRFDDDEPGNSTARIILETALDESTPPETFSISKLIASIERQLPAHRPKVQPLPSWLRESREKRAELDRFVREPDFLPEALPDLGAAPTVPSARVEDDIKALLRATEAEVQSAEPLPAFDFGEEAFDQTTRPSSSADILAEPEALETEWLPYTDAANLEAVFEPYDAPEAAPPEELPEGWGEVDARYDAPGTSDLAETVAVREPTLDPMATEVGPASPVETRLEEPPVLEGDSVSYTKPYAIGELQASILSAVDSEALVYLEDDADRAARDAQAVHLKPAAMPDGAPAVEDADIFSLRHIEDPYIAQLALSLTELSLETTAEAALLSRDNAIVAFAGRMLREDVEALQTAIDGKWDANIDEARIRFLTLEGSGKDYMLYSRRTVDDLSLSLIFSGQTPLRDIRRQGKRLIEALRAVPEVAVPEPEPPIPELELVPIDETLTRTSFAYLWLTRDASAPLSSSLAQVIANVLHNQLAKEAWRVHDIQAHEEYVYLLSDVPGDAPPYKVVRELKRRAAEIACQYNPTLNPDTLWADSYLVVMPGRSLDPEEIQQFINFERML
ncbi:MAG: transposase [Aggregatilineales bacterium]